MRRTLCIMTAISVIMAMGTPVFAMGDAGGLGEPAPNGAVAGMPDVGHVAAQRVSTKGIGATEGKALLDALKTAVMEINGTTISVNDISTQGNADAHLTAQDSAGDSSSVDAYFQSRSFLHQVSQWSGGMIDHFMITKVQKPGFFDKQFTVSVDAYINKFHVAKSSAKKLKIVIAPVHVGQPSYYIAGTEFSANRLSAEITREMANALVQSGRFDVLDRSGDPAVEQELDLIGSGKADKQNLAKLNQTIPADVVLLGNIESVEYLRHSQSLAISDRPLVSYDGRWAFSDRVVNVTTSAVISSGEFVGAFPKVGPTTMPINVDPGRLLATVENAVVTRAVAQLIREVYPITVVSIQGDVVILSQGGDSLRIGEAYQLVKAGQLLRDPQTGEPIGHIKMPVGTLMVDRVDERLAYGHLLDGHLTSLATDGSVRVGEAVAELMAHHVSKANTARVGVVEQDFPGEKDRETTAGGDRLGGSKQRQVGGEAPKVVQPVAPKDDPNW